MGSKGFGLPRCKIFGGEAIDLSIPTYDGGIGDFILQHSQDWGRIGTLGEIYGELEIIVDGPVDDKTEKRIMRMNFLNLFSNNPIIDVFFKHLTFYLNGSYIDGDKGHIGCICSGAQLLISAKIVKDKKYLDIIA